VGEAGDDRAVHALSGVALPPPIVYSRDGKEPSLLGFGSIQVLTKVRVRFGLSSSQTCAENLGSVRVWFLCSQF